MSFLTDNPEIMIEVLAKLVHRAGGYVKVTGAEHPAGPFNLASKIIDGGIELRLLAEGETIQ